MKSRLHSDHMKIFNLKLLPNKIACAILCLFIFTLVFEIFPAPVVLAQTMAPEMQSAAPAQPGFMEVLSRMAPMFALVFMIYYFMIVKPQQMKIKSQTELTSSLKKGDTVVTSSGIFGKVSLVESDSVSVEVAPNVKIKFELSHVARKVEAGSETSAGGSNSGTVSRVK